jgi:hypothetical protein
MKGRKGDRREREEKDYDDFGCDVRGQRDSRRSCFLPGWPET